MEDLLDALKSVSLISNEDKRIWELDPDEEIFVKTVCISIDRSILPCSSTTTRWIRTIPRKINIHAGRVILDRLTTRSNLCRRGINVPSILCALCEAEVEISCHVFGDCSLSNEV